MSSREAKEAALQGRAKAQARWKVITPLVRSLREIRQENHLAERIRQSIREEYP